MRRGLCLSVGAFLLTALLIGPNSAQVFAAGGSFLPLKFGQSLTYQVTDANGFTWEMRILVSGRANIQVFGDRYFVMDSVGYTWPTEVNIIIFRSTQEEVFSYGGLGNEFLAWQDAPIGTTWTYDQYGHTIERTIEAVETVSVPAGTFEGVLRFRQRCLNCGLEPILYTREWVKPGFGMVKEIDYFGDVAPPRVKLLTDWTR